MPDLDPLDANNTAYEAYQTRMREDGIMGPVSSSRSLLYPGTDSMSVQRVGPVQTPSSYVSVRVVDGPMRALMTLSVSDARRMAMALLDAADECSGVSRLAFDVTPW